MVGMGGPQDVWEEDRHPWLRGEKEAIRNFVEEMKRPYLGICLGHHHSAWVASQFHGLHQRLAAFVNNGVPYRSDDHHRSIRLIFEPSRLRLYIRPS
jgi:anthranilate/para-aminobenzoate synthase component II